MIPLRHLLIASVIPLTTLGLAACGDSDESSETTTETTGAAEPAPADTGTTPDTGAASDSAADSSDSGAMTGDTGTMSSDTDSSSSGSMTAAPDAPATTGTSSEPESMPSDAGSGDGPTSGEGSTNPSVETDGGSGDDATGTTQPNSQ